LLIILYVITKALSVVKILEGCGCYDQELVVGKRMHGKVATVINRSEIVGRPLAAMLANDGAKVYSCDVDSIVLFEGGRVRRVDEGDDGMTVEKCVRSSSIVVTGVPVKSYKLNTEWIQENTTVVNVASFKNVDETELLKIAGVKYVPLVGKVTVAMLERNLMRLYKQYHDPRREKEASVVKVLEDVRTTQMYIGGAVIGILALTLFNAFGRRSSDL
jgi:methylenetetrahydrofolate dehydrogenase (NAD+)